MEMVLSNGFFEMTSEEMELVAGGGWVNALQAFAGTVLIAVSPAVGVGASIVSTPVGGVAAAGSCAGLGMSLLGAAMH